MCGRQRLALGARGDTGGECAGWRESTRRRRCKHIAWDQYWGCRRRWRWCCGHSRCTITDYLCWRARAPHSLRKSHLDISGICITRNSTIRDALDMLDRSGLGVLLLVKDDRSFERTVTDGDLRRLLLEGTTLDQSLTVIASRRSVVLPENSTMREALALMQQHTIDHLPVVDVAGTIIELVERRGIGEQILVSTPH